MKIVDIEFDGRPLGSNGWYSKNMDGDMVIGVMVYYNMPCPDVISYYQAK